MLFIILGVSAFLGVMFWAIFLPFKPDSLKSVGRFVCRKGEKIEVLTSVASYHKPGEKSIEIYCNDYGKRRDVKGKTLLLALIFSFILMLPFSIAIVVLLDKFFLN